MLRFFLITTGLALVLFASVKVGADRELIAYPSFAGEILIFLSATHIGLFYLISRQIGTRPEDFVKIYLGSVVLRILSFGIFIFLIIRLDPVSGWRNAVLFLLSYFLFTALEVGLLYVELNRAKPARTGQKEG